MRKDGADGQDMYGIRQATHKVRHLAMLVDLGSQKHANICFAKFEQIVDWKISVNFSLRLPEEHIQAKPS